MRKICRADKTLIALLIRVQGAIDWNPQLPVIAIMLSMHFGSPFSESAECYYVSNETKNRDDATGKINHHKANHVRCRFFFQSQFTGLLRFSALHIGWYTQICSSVISLHVMISVLPSYTKYVLIAILD